MALNTASEVNFASMVAFPATGASRLTQVRALEGDFPFYGYLETIPASGDADFRAGGKKALVEKILMAQFDAQVGDIIKVGEVEFEIAGELQSVPGQTGITATVAPAVYIPMAYLEETGLVQYGSRVEYNRYFVFAENTDIDLLIEPFEDEWEIERIDADTVEDRKRSTGRSFENLSNFLSLVAFIALLLGCVGVASAVNVFVKEKLASVAVLRCLGVSSRDVLLIYLFEILVMGLFWGDLRFHTRDIVTIYSSRGFCRFLAGGSDSRNFVAFSRFWSDYGAFCFGIICLASITESSKCVTDGYASS